MSICPDCQAELFDPTDRRYRYPFINCTNCGPRFSIIQDIPYDRPNTTMSGFQLCEQCSDEYHNPRNRRFHAQPIACPDCGPRLFFEVGTRRKAEGDDALIQARKWIQLGKIIAIKGLGGYHLACDATNPAAVAELRRRKKRSDKPFALMAFDMTAVEQYCIVNQPERDLLLSRQKPVVLLEQKPGSSLAIREIAPGLTTLGVMLAYTPLHLLILEPEDGYPNMLVMTSGNLSEEPIAYQDEDAADRLGSLADAFLTHDRPIHIRVDDSVVVNGVDDRPYLYRRSRGYAPDPLLLPASSPQILAVGAELKNTFCLTRDQYAFLSHHIGDMENLETFQAFEEGIQHYQRLFRIQPEALACDLHPNYLATRYAENRAVQENLPLIRVQHHHAHLAACLADCGWDFSNPVIGLCYDGTGYGSDGAIWGGEFMYGGYLGFERLYHLAYAPLAGGDLSVQKPSRMALAHLWQAGIDWDPAFPAVDALCQEERTVLSAQLEHHINTPPTSSMGRLFDAASAIMGIRQVATYEGQAAIEMEALADPSETGAYQFDIYNDEIDPTPLWNQLLEDWYKHTPVPVMAGRFHNSVAVMSSQLCQQIRERTDCSTVVLSGGVWQNRLLLAKTIHNLSQAGFQILTHSTGAGQRWRDRIRPGDDRCLDDQFVTINREVVMCLGVPGKIVEINTENGIRMGRIDFGGVIREACLEAVPDAIIGDYTIVHAGFALSLLSEDEANETLNLLREISLFDDAEDAGIAGIG